MKIIYIIIFIVLSFSCTKKTETVVKKKEPLYRPSLNKVDLALKKKLDEEKSIEQKDKDCLVLFSNKFKTDKTLRDEYFKLCRIKHNNDYCHDLTKKELEPILKKVCK
jgi:hypothetical protein